MSKITESTADAQPPQDPQNGTDKGRARAENYRVTDPEVPGTSGRYVGKAILRRYMLWYSIVGAAFFGVGAAASNVLLPNQVQMLEIANFFTGNDSSVDLLALEQLRSAVNAGTAVATTDQARMLGILAEFDVSRAQSLALILALGVIAMAIVQPVIGVISDRTRSRFGRRSPFILGGMGAGALAISAMPFAPTITVMAIVWICISIFIAGAIGPLNATLADRVPSKRLGSVSAIAAVGTFVGGVTAAASTGALFIFIGLGGWFLIGITCLVTAIAFVGILKERSSMDLALRPRLGLGALFSGFLVPLRAANFRWVWIARVSLVFGYSITQALQLFMLQSYIQPQLSQAAATALIPMLTIAPLPLTVIAVLITGKLSDRVGRRKPFVIFSSVAMAIAMLLPFFSPTLPALFAHLILVSVAFGVYLPVDQALFVDVLPDMSHAARDLGMAAVAGTIGLALAPLAAGQILSLTGGYAMIFPVAFIFVLFAGLAILRVKNIR